MKKIIILAILITMLTPTITFAASTLLPEETSDCTKTEEALNKLTIKDQKDLMKTNERDGILGCAIQTGNIHLWMLPYYITYIIEFLMNIAGLISVLFVIIGGYLYAWGGLTEDKEKG